MATLRIDDDDTAETVIDLSVDTDPAEGDQTSIGEDAGTVLVTLTATLRGTKSHDTPTVVTVNPLAGTATGGTDYANPTLPASITIPAGALEAQRVLQPPRHRRLGPRGQRDRRGDRLRLGLHGVGRHARHRRRRGRRRRRLP